MPIDETVARGGVRQAGQDGQWSVRNLAGSDKAYRCPGCQQLIPAGAAHVVAWNRADLRGEAAGIADRRHWHGACWQRQERLL